MYGLRLQHLTLKLIIFLYIGRLKQVWTFLLLSLISLVSRRLLNILKVVPHLSLLLFNAYVSFLSRLCLFLLGRCRCWSRSSEGISSIPLRVHIIKCLRRNRVILFIGPLLAKRIILMNRCLELLCFVVLSFGNIAAHYCGILLVSFLFFASCF